MDHLQHPPADPLKLRHEQPARHAGLQGLGLALPSPPYLIGALVFGLVGLVAWRRGRRQGQPVTRWLGVALMLFPYGVSSTLGLYLVGAALCAGVVADQRGLF